MTNLLLLIGFMVATPAPRAVADAGVPDAGARSVFTTLAGCRLARRNDAGETVRRCPGVAGFKLELLDADERVSINLVAQAGRTFRLDYWGTVTKDFSQTGARAEWRLVGRGKSARPIAIVVPLEVNEYIESKDGDDRPNHVTYFIVAKVSDAEACVTDKLPAKTTTKQQVRDTADSAGSRPCLPQLTPPRAVRPKVD